MFKNFFKKEEDIPLPLKAIQTLNEGNYPTALNLLNRYIQQLETSGKKLDADDALFYFNRSIAKTQLSDMQGAIDDLTKSITINPLFVQGIAERGRILMAIDRWDEAKRDYSRCLEIDQKNSAEYLCQRGYANFNCGNQEQAIEDFIDSYKRGNKEAENILRERTNYFNKQ